MSPTTTGSSSTLPILPVVFTEFTANSNFCTNLPPLTTIFTPPADCSQSWASSIDKNATGYTTFWQNLGSPWRSCFPGDYDANCISSGIQSTPNQKQYYPTFSPGRCPRGYTTATQVQQSSPKQTVAACCRSGFTANYPESQCISDIKSSQDVTLVHSTTRTVLLQTKLASTSGADLFVTLTTEQPATTTIAMSTGKFVAPMLWVAFNKGQIPSLASSTSIASTAATLSHEGSDHKNSSLSTGAKAAIGIVVVVGTIFLVSALLWWFRRRATKKRGLSSSNWDKAELEGKALGQDSGRAFAPERALLDSAVRSELPASEKTHEVETIELHELDATKPHEMDGHSIKEGSVGPSAEEMSWMPGDDRFETRHKTG